MPWAAPAGSASDAAAESRADRLEGGAMTLETLVEAIRIAVRLTLTAGDSDLKLPDGAID